MSINMLCFGYRVAVFRQAVKNYLAPSAHGKNTVDLRSLDTWRNLPTGKRQRRQISHTGCPTGEQPRMWLGPGNKALIFISGWLAYIWTMPPLASMISTCFISRKMSKQSAFTYTVIVYVSLKRKRKKRKEMVICPLLFLYLVNSGTRHRANGTAIRR